MADLSIQVPRIDSVSLAPNPVSINSRMTLVVTVVEQTIQLEPVYFYAGEMYSGEG